MHYAITHQTCYVYDRPVQLDRHSLRLCPRSDGSQWLRQFSLQIEPRPLGQTYLLDAEGNTVISVWFDTTSVTALQITSRCEVETCRSNPFNYLSEAWAIATPLDYPQSLAAQLQAYLRPPLFYAEAPAVVELAQELLTSVRGNVGQFLMQLNQAIGQRCEYRTRHEGDPWPAGLTLSKQAGSCRDFAVLFVAACRAVGLAARFVSGYQEGDPDQRDRDLHAWAEVYVPGGGWRGFDPTLGLAVGDRHIALAATAVPTQAAPVSGQLKPGQQAQSQLKSQIELIQLT